MSNGEYSSIRAYRPGCLSWSDGEHDPEPDHVREANLKMYAERVAAGLPLFEKVGLFDRFPGSVS